MATTKLRYWTPNQTYDFQLRIGGVDYTPDLQRVTIVTSIMQPYQTFVLEMFQDANELILDKVYGQEPIFLTIRLLTQTGEIAEKIDIELFYLTSDYDLLTKTSNPQEDDKVRSRINLVTVVRTAFLIMGGLTTGLFFGSTISSVIQNIVGLVPNTPSLNLDSEGANPEEIDQVLVPPMSFYKAVKYLDTTFGVFDGAMGLYCLFDGNIYIKNLAKKLKSSHEFTLHLLSTDTAEQTIIELPLDGKSFYTWNPISTSYAANSIFGVIGGYQRHIVKPSDTLFADLDVTMDSFAQSYGVIEKNPKIYADSEATGFEDISGRTGIYYGHTGYETTEHHINARMSRSISELSMIYATLTSKNIVVLNLMNVGEAVKFSSKTSDYVQLTGKYILKSSDISFYRLRDWEANASLQLIRTNRAIQ